MDKNPIVNRLKKIGVVRRGDFDLKSGKESDVYFDIKKAFGDAETLNILADALWNILDFNVDCVAASGYGGIPIASILSQKHDLKLTLVRDENKDHGTKNLIEGFVPGKRDKVVLVDDVVTTGLNLRNILRSLQSTGCDVVGAGVVIKRGDVDFDFSLRCLLSEDDF